MSTVFTAKIRDLIQLPKGDYIVEIGDGRIRFFELRAEVAVEPKEVENGGPYEIEVTYDRSTQN